LVKERNELYKAIKNAVVCFLRKIKSLLSENLNLFPERKGFAMHKLPDGNFARARPRYFAFRPNGSNSIYAPGFESLPLRQFSQKVKIGGVF